MNHDGQVFVLKVLVEQVAQFRLRPHQVHTHGQIPAGQDSSPNFRLGSLVRAHGVKRDVDEHIAFPGKTFLKP